MTDDHTEKQRVKHAQAVRMFLDNWAFEVELIGVKAKIARARYLALRREGFDVPEALQLCIRQVEI